MNTRGPLKGDGNIFKCEWVLNLKQHFRQWCLRTWMIQHRYLTLWKLSLTFWGSFAPLGRITAKQWQPGTHRYLCIPHSLSFTAIKFLSLFIIYKIAKDFEKFSAQAPVLEGHKGAEEEEDAESSTPLPKSQPWCPSDVQGVHPCPSHMETCSGGASFLPILSGKVTPSSHKSDNGEGKQLCINTPRGLWQHQRGASVAFCSVSHTNCSSYCSRQEVSSAKCDNFICTSHKKRGLENY